MIPHGTPNVWGTKPRNPAQFRSMLLNTILFRGRDKWIWKVMRGTVQMASGEATIKSDAQRQINAAKLGIRKAEGSL